MECYFGYIETVLDALLIFEACRLGVLMRVHRRLTDQERANIRSGSVFVWDEDETGIHRWTDGRSWSSSRARGSFLTYRELDDPTNPVPPASSSSMSNSETKAKVAAGENTDTSPNEGASQGPDFKEEQDEDFSTSPSFTSSGRRLRLRRQGLTKRALSLSTADGRKFHLISYYLASDVATNRLKTPRMDKMIASIKIPELLYPELVSEIGPDGRETWRFATTQGRGHASATSLRKLTCITTIPSRNRHSDPPSTGVMLHDKLSRFDASNIAINSLCCSEAAQASYSQTGASTCNHYNERQLQQQVPSYYPRPMGSSHPTYVLPEHHISQHYPVQTDTRTTLYHHEASLQQDQYHASVGKCDNKHQHSSDFSLHSSSTGPSVHMTSVLTRQPSPMPNSWPSTANSYQSPPLPRNVHTSHVNANRVHGEIPTYHQQRPSMVHHPDCHDTTDPIPLKPAGPLTCCHSHCKPSGPSSTVPAGSWVSVPEIPTEKRHNQLAYMTPREMSASPLPPMEQHPITASSRVASYPTPERSNAIYLPDNYGAPEVTSNYTRRYQTRSPDCTYEHRPSHPHAFHPYRMSERKKRPVFRDGPLEPPTPHSLFPTSSGWLTSSSLEPPVHNAWPTPEYATQNCTCPGCNVTVSESQRLDRHQFA